MGNYTLPSAASLTKAGQVPGQLDQKLMWLCSFGKPVLSMLDHGWHACISMNTNTTGASFDVRSEFRISDPVAAVDQLIERMLATLAKLGSTPNDRSAAK